MLEYKGIGKGHCRSIAKSAALGSTPTSAGHKPSLNSETGSNERLSNIGACNTASSPPNINPTDEANAPLIYAAISAKCSDDGQSSISFVVKSR